MRTFLSITPPVPIQDEIASLQRLLRARLANSPFAHTFRWSVPHKLHLTLRFLGETTADQRDRLATALAPIAAGTLPIEVTFARLGVFPSRRKPAVFWLGVEENGPLRALQREVEAAVVASGIVPDDHPWSPHITLARIRRDGTMQGLGDELHALASSDEIAGWQTHFTARRVELMCSELHPSGARYTLLRAFDLGADPAK